MSPSVISTEEAKARLEDLLYHIENIKSEHPDEARIIGLNRSNHEYLLQALLSSAMNQDPFILSGTTVYCPYPVSRLKAYLKQKAFPISRDERNLWEKMKRLVYNWEVFIHEATDAEIPQELLRNWEMRQDEHGLRCTIYAIDLSLSFHEILAKTVEKARISRQRSITQAAATRGECITANDGMDTCEHVHSQREVGLTLKQERMLNHIEAKAATMYREHEVVTLDGVIQYLLEDETSRRYFMNLKEGSRKAIVQGYLPGVTARMGLLMDQITRQWQHRYPYLRNKKVRSKFFHNPAKKVEV